MIIWMFQINLFESVKIMMATIVETLCLQQLEFSCRLRMRITNSRFAKSLDPVYDYADPYSDSSRDW